MRGLCPYNEAVWQNKKEEKYFIFNHLSFTVAYHKDPQNTDYRIVGFEVAPFRFASRHTPKTFLFLELPEFSFEFLCEWTIMI